jgi:ABC-2 type transport system permease protein
VRFEIRNILKSRFLLVMAIIVLAVAVAVPVISLILENRAKNNNNPSPMPMAVAMPVKEYTYSGMGTVYMGGGDGQPITVGNVTVTTDNPLYWNLQNLIQQKDAMQGSQGQYTTPQALDLASDLTDAQIQYYASMAQYVTGKNTYLTDVVYQCADKVTDKFIYEHPDASADDLLQAVMNQKGMDKPTFLAKYINITADARKQALDGVNAELAQMTQVVQNNDFEGYIALSIQQQNDQIKSLQDTIDLLQQQIIKNPDQEENLSGQIDSNKSQIKVIQENTIPLLQYRLKKHIVPGDNSWQNMALSDIDSNRSQLLTTTLVSQEDFQKAIDLVQQYKTYQKYKTAVQKQLDTFNNNIVIAQKSLDADKPDMKFVSSGSRSRTVIFLDFSAAVAMFAVLLGGWLIASEFQQGTIRLLMIRPRKRVKILLSKFAGAFAVCLALYLASNLLNILVNGFCFGFADYGFPNFSVAGPAGFFVWFLPELLACIVPILFGFTFAFLLSTVTRNIAVSIAVPVVCYVGSIIAMVLSFARPSLAWITWTPLPYVWLPLFYTPGFTDTFTYSGFTFNIPYGIGLLLALSAVCTAISVIVFKRRDITN